MNVENNKKSGNLDDSVFGVYDFPQSSIYEKKSVGYYLFEPVINIWKKYFSNTSDSSKNYQTVVDANGNLKKSASIIPIHGGDLESRAVNIERVNSDNNLEIMSGWKSPEQYKDLFASEIASELSDKGIYLGFEPNDFDGLKKLVYDSIPQITNKLKVSVASAIDNKNDVTHYSNVLNKVTEYLMSEKKSEGHLQVA